MKNLTIAGRLTRDAELRTLNDGSRVASFSVAVDDRAGKEKSTLFFDCSLFGKRGEALAPHLAKGSSVTVGGDFGKREHDGKTYLTLRVENVTLQGGKPAGASNHGFSGAAGKADPAQTYDLSDDIPF